MTDRDEKRVIWVLVFCVGLTLVLLPVERYALLNFAAGCLLMVAAIVRLWMLRRRIRRREPRLEP
jgi:hypothetical protein